MSSFELMLRAGTCSAAFVLRDYSGRLSHGVALFAGSGNNGGDVYVTAAQLARAGVTVRVQASGPPRTDDARRAAALAARYLTFGRPTGKEGVVVDGVLGTGHRGAFRDGAVESVHALGFARDRGATIVALDVPSGLDASTGEIAHNSVAADVTLCFGTVKRGVLFQRGHVGRIVVIDIGLRGPLEPDDGAWFHADERLVSRSLPPIAWDAHKGTRGHLALVGGATGMAGAIILATQGALASGCGLAKVYVEAPGIMAVQHGASQAIAIPWPAVGEDGIGTGWGHAIAAGPGLGRSMASSALLERALRENAGVPVVLDADALTLATMGNDSDPASVIRQWCEGREHVVLTPHPGEFSRLLREQSPAGWQERADALVAFAIRARATVLLKGSPTLIAMDDGAPPIVVARGTSLLATGGSGDLLTGIIGALLAGGMYADAAATIGAMAHGIAAEIATQKAGVIRGLTLEAVVASLPDAWRRLSHPATLQQDVLSDLPSLVI